MSTTFDVEGLHCTGCSKKIIDAIAGVQPGAKVEIDIKGGQVLVDDVQDRAAIVRAIESAGYALRQAA